MPLRWRHGGDIKESVHSMAQKLTKRTVDALAPTNRAYIVYDEDLAGFGCRVMPTGTKSWVVEYRPHGGGRGGAKKRITLSKVGPLTAEQARKAAADLLAKVRLGADPAAERDQRRASATVSQLIEAFAAEHVRGKLKASTGKSYEAGLELLAKAHGSLKAEALTRAQLATLHAKLRETPFAANRALAAWSKMFSWAVARGLVPEGHNPARRIERYREERRERFLTPDELARLGAALIEAETVGLPWDVDDAKPTSKHLAKEERRRTRLVPYVVAAFRLLIFTGARLREILTAKWSQFDRDRGVLFLDDSKTGRKTIYLSGAAMEILAVLPRIYGCPYIVAGANAGSPRSDLKKPWASICRAAGLEGVRIHDLRHSFASVGAGASLGLPIIGKLMGHNQAATTHRYAHLDVDPLRRAVDAIGETLVAAMSSKRQEA
jgi:integrase